MLKPDTAAPSLTVETLDGGTFDITTARPQAFTLIAVYRGLHCPICKPWINSLDALTDDFRAAGVEPLAVSTDSRERAEAARNDWDLKTVPVGYGLSIGGARAWGLAISNSIAEKEPRQFAEPGIFLVRPDGTLYAAAIQTMPFARPAFADILKAAKFVQEKNYPARGTA